MVQSLASLLNVQEILTSLKTLTLEIDQETFDLEKFIKKLFSKSSELYFKSKNTTELSNIAHLALLTLNEIFKSNESLVINSKIDTRGRIWISQLDRPFIINTINEVFKDYPCEVYTILHPIINNQEKQISLCYIETNILNETDLGDLISELKFSLTLLNLVTKDYEQILTNVKKFTNQINNSENKSKINSEQLDFLKWLSDGCFIFLGYCCWSTSNFTTKNSLGLLSNSAFAQDLEPELKSDLQENILESNFNITRLRTKSPVHRRSQMTHLFITESDRDSKIINCISIIGLFTTKAFDQESRSIPIIRKKLEQILKLEEVADKSFEYKSIVNIVDSMPKDDLLRIDLEQLQGIVRKILHIQNQNKTSLNIRFDKQKKGVSILVLLPRDHFSTKIRDAIQKYLEHEFQAKPGTSEYQLDYNLGSHARLYFYIPLGQGLNIDINLYSMEQKIAELASNWESDLRNIIINNNNINHAEYLINKYAKSFSLEYQAVNTVMQAFNDLIYLEQFTANQRLKIRYELDGDPKLVIYSLKEELTLSKTLPIFENAGFEVLSDSTCTVEPAGAELTHIQRFWVKPKANFNLDTFEPNFSESIQKILEKKAVDDVLNTLILYAELPLTAINLIRSYCDYLWQIDKFAARSVIYSSFANQANLAKIFWQTFEIKFNPNLNLSINERIEQVNQISKTYNETLKSVHDITTDKILRSLFDLLKNTVRTNFYQTPDALALKIDARKCTIISEPRPLYEVFINSQNMQGIHLRSTKVSRGGIRWSDRHQDYRIEVLGLMRTQKIKNALIVPSGAKGGFVIKDQTKDNVNLIESAKAGYRSYVRALLSITDNYLDGNIKTPENLIVYDQHDPYLVVAADKGTATFSDIANKIAIEEYDFWLGDAFASGGSQGYDHKLYGITAKGAWECVKRHFNDSKLDYLNQAFTAVGIGDMSGDVFGNGLLLSNQYKLIAAFNHKHIFIDPNPDPLTSFKERERLFKTPGSQWSDYDSSIITKGGGVYNKYDKEIILSAEAIAALNCDLDCNSSISGETLISLILKAPVDLLWNGGIGTYFKATEESNADVNDSTNDPVRINAAEIRAKVIGEGGNLGFTQRARIEYASIGGLLNTDAIDNSAGVDLSDHEVNLKILFKSAIKKGTLNITERNKILSELAPAVCQQVLDHNRNQALSISVSKKRSFFNRHYLISLIREVIKHGTVNRRIDFLPDDEEINNRARKSIGLYNPELAILLSATKLNIKNSVKNTVLLADPYLEKLLFDYFPAAIHQRFTDEIINHPLREEIIATQLANYLVDAVGISFLHRMSIKHAVELTTVIKCTLAAIEILEDHKIKDEIRKFDTPQDCDTFMNLGYQLGRAVREVTTWLIREHANNLTLNQIIAKYRDAYINLILGTKNLFQETNEIYQERLAQYKKLALNEFVAHSMLGFPRIMAIFELIWCAKELDTPQIELAKNFIEIYNYFNIDSLITNHNKLLINNKWEQELLNNASEELYRGVSLTTIVAYQHKLSLDQIKRTKAYLSFQQILEDVNREAINLASFTALARAIKIFVEDLKKTT